MGINTLKVALWYKFAHLTIVLVFACSAVFAQKADSIRVYSKPKVRANNIPQIKASVPTYKPNTYGYYPSISTTGTAVKEKSEKSLTILKIYPNPVVEQLNINLRISKETVLSIKITDLLGNEIATLLNEKVQHGEFTKTFNMPSKISAGIYFLRIVAGGEPIIKRISVL